MANEQFKAGDVVRIKSGGPKMTVLWVDEHTANCMWYNKAVNTYDTYIVSLVALSLVNEGDAGFDDYFTNL